MRITLDEVSVQESAERGRDFTVKFGSETYEGRLGAFCIGDISELYLITSKPEVYSIAINKTPERLAYVLGDDEASASNVFSILKHVVSMAEQES